MNDEGEDIMLDLADVEAIQRSEGDCCLLQHATQLKIMGVKFTPEAAMHVLDVAAKVLEVRAKP